MWERGRITRGFQTLQTTLYKMNLVPVVGASAHLKASFEKEINVSYQYVPGTRAISSDVTFNIPLLYRDTGNKKD